MGSLGTLNFFIISQIKIKQYIATGAVLQLENVQYVMYIVGSHKKEASLTLDTLSYIAPLKKKRFICIAPKSDTFTFNPLICTIVSPNS